MEERSRITAGKTVSERERERERAGVGMAVYLGGDGGVTGKPPEGSVEPTGCRERGQSPGFTLVTVKGGAGSAACLDRPVKSPPSPPPAPWAHCLSYQLPVCQRRPFQVILHGTHPMGPKSPGSRASSYVENRHENPRRWYTV